MLTLRLSFLLVCLLLCLAFGYLWRHGIFADWSVNDIFLWFFESDIRWCHPSGIASDWFFHHCVVIGWIGPRPQYILLVESLKGEAVHYLKHVLVTAVFFTGFLICFYSFQDGSTLYFFSYDSDSFLFSRSVLMPFPLLVSS